MVKRGSRQSTLVTKSGASTPLGGWFWRHPRIARAVIAMAVVVGAPYLGWRLVATSAGVDPWLFWPLLVAEAVGYATIVIMAIEAGRPTATPRPPALDTFVEIVVCVGDEHIDTIEPTLLGALAVRGRTSVTVCDIAGRADARALADRLGVAYLTGIDSTSGRAGAIATVLAQLRGELVLVLGADQVPLPDILEALSGYFIDPRVALVQSAQAFRNHDSVMHRTSARLEPSPLREALHPARTRLHQTFWSGSAALVRVSALRHLSRLAPQAPAHELEISLLLQEAGFTLRFHNEHLVQGLAPNTLAAYVTQRARSASSTMSAYRWRRLPFGRDLERAQTLSYLGVALRSLMPLQRLVFAVYIVLIGAFGLMPVTITDGGARALLVAWLVIAALASTALHRGTAGRIEYLRTLMLTVEPHLRALAALVTRRPPGGTATPTNEPDRGGVDALRIVRFPLIVASIVLGVLLARLADTIAVALGAPGVLPPLAPEAFAVITVLSLVDIALTVQLAVRAHRRRQNRSLWRFPTSLPARVDAQLAECVDLHQNGAALTVSGETVENVSTVTIAIECRQLDGSTTTARGSLTITSRVAVGTAGSQVRIGGPVVWNDDASRDAVIMHCYVVEPYAARNRAWMRSTSRMTVLLPATVGTVESTCVDLSTSGAAFVTREAGFAMHDRVPVELVIHDGERVDGVLKVRNMTALPSGLLRIGGVVDWNRTDWMERYGAVASSPTGRRATRHAERAGAR